MEWNGNILKPSRSQYIARQRTTNNGRRSFMEDDLWWKTTFDRRPPSMKDNLQWKTTSYRAISRFCSALHRLCGNFCFWNRSCILLFRNKPTYQLTFSWLAVRIWFLTVKIFVKIDHVKRSRTPRGLLLYEGQYFHALTVTFWEKYFFFLDLGGHFYWDTAGKISGKVPAWGGGWVGWWGVQSHFRVKPTCS